MKIGDRVKIVKGTSELENQLIRKGNVDLEVVRFVKGHPNLVVLRERSGFHWLFNRESLTLKDSN